MRILKRFWGSRSLLPKEWRRLENANDIELAFVLGGTKYYHFKSEFNICSGRAHDAIDVYDELNMKCDRDYLEEHIKVVDQLIESAQKGLTDKGNTDLNSVYQKLHKIQVLNDQIKQRLKWITHKESVLKLASIMYFDESEDPRHYDEKYNAEVKIPKWRKHKGFFLEKPMKDMLPFGKLSTKDLETYLEVQSKAHEQMLENIQEVSLQETKKSGTSRE